MYRDSLPDHAQRTTPPASPQHGHRHRVLCTSSAQLEPVPREPSTFWDDDESVEQPPSAVLFAFVAELRDRLAEEGWLPTHATSTSANDRVRLSKRLGMDVTVDGFRLLAGPIYYAQLVDGQPLSDAALDQLTTGWLALLP